MAKNKKTKEKLNKGIPLTEKEKARLSAPRNEIVRKLSEQGGQNGAGLHKDKRWESKYGKEKYKKKNFGYD